MHHSRALGPILAALLLLGVACTSDEQVKSPGAPDVSDAAADTAATVDVVQPVDASPPVDAGCTYTKDCPLSDDPCASWVCHPELDCVKLILPDGAICDDNDACSPVAVCANGKCGGVQAKNCDDNKPCTQDSCDPATGDCKHTMIDAGVDCDDGDVCSHATLCDGQGQCAGGQSKCSCQKDKDCDPFEDGDACNGTLICELKAGAPQGSATCIINPASVVTCAAKGGDACNAPTCDPQTGQCGLAAVVDKSPCTDGDGCTAGDWCKGGDCQPGTDVCCKQDADCVPFDDGDICNGTMFCNLASGQCLPNPKSVVVCQSVDDTSCLHNDCQKLSGKCVFVPLPDGATCTDAQACTVGDVCKTGSCEPGPDTCFCKTHNDCLPYDDGDLCNGTLICNKANGKCQLDESSVVVCASVDDTACLENHCAPKLGKCGFVALPDSVTCDADGTICTAVDRCKGGTCLADPANTCACQKNADCSAFEDGNPCNGTLYCDKKSGKCSLNPATIVYCATVDDGDCVVNKCQPETGACKMQPINDKKACAGDGNPCTPTDICVEGACVLDANVCSCQTDLDCGQYQDSNGCNGELYCDKSTKKCVPNPATVPECPTWENTACLQSRCVVASGTCELLAINDYKNCDADGNPCTAYDTCKAGTCLAGANLCACQLDADCIAWDDSDPCNGALYCDKGGAEPFFCEVNPASKIVCGGGDPKGCNTSSCDSALAKCVPGDAKDTKPCDDSNPCTLKDACEQGSCGGLPKVCPGSAPCMVYFCLEGSGLCSQKQETCDDGNDCTVDTACDPLKGCSHLSLADGKLCNDFNPCTPSSSCKGGQCLPAKPACDDGEACTTDSCGADGKCSHKTLADGAACDDGDLCTAGTSCKSQMPEPP